MRRIKKFDDYLKGLNKIANVNSGKTFTIQGQDANKLAASLLDFMKTQGVSFKEGSEPVINFTREKQRESPFLRATGYYVGDKNEITIYTKERSLKDCLRSLAHELIHADQNINKGIDITKASDGIYGKSEEAEEIEEDAYRRGNLIFRKWEESLRNSLS